MSAEYVYVVVKTSPVNGHPELHGVFHSQADAHKYKDTRKDPTLWVLTSEVK